MNIVTAWEKNAARGAARIGIFKILGPFFHPGAPFSPLYMTGREGSTKNQFPLRVLFSTFDGIFLWFSISVPSENEN